MIRLNRSKKQIPSQRQNKTKLTTSKQLHKQSTTEFPNLGYWILESNTLN